MRPLRRPLIVLVGLLALTASAVRADKVYLIDGGSREGKVRVEGDRVIVEFAGGSITLDRDQVARIEYGDDPYTTLATRIRQLDARDARGHYREGLWAAEHDLGGPARELFTTAVNIRPDYAEANLALGRVWLNGAWADSATLTEQLHQWLGDGLNAAALAVGRQALAGLLSAADRRELLELTATAARRLGYFSQALTDYQELVGLLPATDPQLHRVTCIAEVLGEHPAGLYLVQVDEFAQAVVRPEQGEPTRSGFYSLGGEAVLDYALRDRAKQLIAQGEAVMDTARRVEVTDADKSAGLYRHADDVFARAEGLTPDIARSYRVEVRRRLIQMHQSKAEALALRVDGLNRQFPNHVRTQADGSIVIKSRQGYRNHLKLILPLLDEIQKELEQVLALAAPYQQELNLIIIDAHDGIATVKALRKTLEGELKLTETARSLGP